MAITVDIEVKKRVEVDILVPDKLAADIVVPNTVIGETVVLNELTCQQLNDGLLQSQRDELQRVQPGKTGQTISHEAFDDGATQLGRGVDFFALDCDNSFANTLRHTDDQGSQVFGAGNGSEANYLIDHLSKLAWKRTKEGTTNFATAQSTANARTFAGFSDWRVANTKEYMTIANFVSVQLFNWAPFNLVGVSNQRLWTSTTRGESAAQGMVFRTDQPLMQNIAKTSNLQYLIVRNHF